MDVGRKSRQAPSASNVMLAFDLETAGMIDEAEGALRFFRHT
jgi:hypothetical protein